MIPDRSTFDEPELKAAVRKAWGGETAPAELRSRVGQMLAEHASDGTGARESRTIQPSFWRGRMGFGMAAAAAVVLGVGLAALQMHRPGSGGVAVANATALPNELGDQLVQRHDSCTRLAPHDHHFFTGAPKDNFKAISQGMTAELHYPVLATPMGSDWDFRGAAMCPVGPTTVAHLIYARGDAFVSVFSLPASMFPSCPDHKNCDAAVKGHPVAGFVEDGAFYAVVGSTGGQTPVDLQQVRAMRDQLRGNLVAAHDESGVRLATISH